MKRARFIKLCELQMVGYDPATVHCMEPLWIKALDKQLRALEEMGLEVPYAVQAQHPDYEQVEYYDLNGKSHLIQVLQAPAKAHSQYFLFGHSTLVGTRAGGDMHELVWRSYRELSLKY